MTARSSPDRGWFEDVPIEDLDALVKRIRQGSAAEPQEWPETAVDDGTFASTDEYYERLRDATLEAARTGVAERERADDQQLIHAIRAYDDCQRTTNELTERVAEWAGSHDAEAEVSTEYVHELAEGTGQSPVEDRLIGLAERVAGLEEERESLRSFVERTAPEVAPNLSALAGPELAARLIAIAGGLESLAKKPAGTVQVLGAEDALFAHLGGNAPSPKHGVIFTHPAVRQASPDNRGSAARALAGKLTIAARVDHYSGDLRPELQADLDDRIERIHARDDE